METYGGQVSDHYDSYGESDFGETNAHGAFGDLSSPSPTPTSMHQRMPRRASCGGRVEYIHPAKSADDDPFSIVETRSLTPPPREYTEEVVVVVEGKDSKKKAPRRRSNESKHSSQEEEDERAERKQRKKERKTRRRKSNDSGEELDVSNRSSKLEKSRRRRSNDNDKSLSSSQHDKPRRRKSNDSGKGELGRSHRMRRRSSCGPGAGYSHYTLDAAPEAPTHSDDIKISRVQRRPSYGPGAYGGDPPRKTLESMLAREDSANTVRTEAMSVFSDETFQTTASGRRRRMPRRMSAPHTFRDPVATEINNTMAVATVGIISEARGLRW